MTRIDELAVLKTLDPAAGEVDPRSARARADLQQILASDPDHQESVVVPLQNRKPARRIAVGAALVAAATTAAILLPAALGGDQAFASWTATPTTLSAEESATASTLCRTKLYSAVAGKPDQDRERLKTATAVISERRGSTTLVVLTGPGGFSAMCLNDRSLSRDRGFGGSYGAVPTKYQPGRRAVGLTDFGVSSIAEKSVSMAIGFAGSEVKAVAYSSPTRGKVSATVAGGRFALWLPGTDLDKAVDSGVPLQVTYRDGTTKAITLMP